jgi:hypothetical protein
MDMNGLAALRGLAQGRLAQVVLTNLLNWRRPIPASFRSAPRLHARRCAPCSLRRTPTRDPPLWWSLAWARLVGAPSTWRRRCAAFNTSNPFCILFSFPFAACASKRCRRCTRRLKHLLACVPDPVPYVLPLYVQLQGRGMRSALCMPRVAVSRPCCPPFVNFSIRAAVVWLRKGTVCRPPDCWPCLAGGRWRRCALRASCAVQGGGRAGVYIRQQRQRLGRARGSGAAEGLAHERRRALAAGGQRHDRGARGFAALVCAAGRVCGHRQHDQRRLHGTPAAWIYRITASTVRPCVGGMRACG